MAKNTYKVEIPFLCASCKKPDKPHKANGLCEKCYRERQYRARKGLKQGVNK